MELDQKILEALLDCAEFFFVIDEDTQKIVYANRRMKEHLTGQTEGLPCYKVLMGRDEPCNFCPALKLGDRTPYVWDWCDTRSNKWLNIKNLLVESGGKQYRVGNVNIVSDMMELSHEAITEYGALAQLVHQYEQTRDELEYTSTHDRMTKLYNRNRYIRDLAELVGLPVGILFFDLNNLKETNDRYGHEAGDEILTRLADSLGEAEQSDRRAYRIGGDEFVVIRRSCTRAELETDLAGIQAELDRRNRAAKHHCVAAVGMAWSADTPDPEALVQAADRLMYEDKARKKAAAGAAI